MKKIIMTIGVFAMMSFGHQKYENWKFNEIMNTLADMEEDACIRNQELEQRIEKYTN